MQQGQDQNETESSPQARCKCSEAGAAPSACRLSSEKGTPPFIQGRHCSPICNSVSSFSTPQPP